MHPSTRTVSDEWLSVVTRGDLVESWHRGSVVVVRDGKVILARGDPDQPVFCRSATKPFQALPLLERGLADRFGFGDAELALVTASHNGTPAHVATAQRILAAGGLTGDDLQCGAHAPFDTGASRALAQAGARPQRLHNNCSGKHAGFLLLARDLGVPAADYLDPACGAQQLVHRAVVEMAGLTEEQVQVAIDGCGAPTFRMPLSGLANAFSRLVDPSKLAPVRANACRRLLQAISAAPEHLAGEGRLCTALVRASIAGNGWSRVFPKNGAEGVYACGLVDTGMGLAIKVSDGQERGYFPVVVSLLVHLGLWQQVPDSLADFLRVPVRNTQKRLVGWVESAVQW